MYFYLLFQLNQKADGGLVVQVTKPMFSSFRSLFVRTVLVCLVGATWSSSAGDSLDVELDRRFAETVRPFVEGYCVDCHQGEKPKAQFDISTYKSMQSVVEGFGHWELVLEKLVAKEMPPEKAEHHPASGQRAEVVGWIRTVRQNEAKKNAGDPGSVPVRRLSTAEYDYTIRDLTGVDIHPTREFPVDPANEAGFDNSADSLVMSPALLKKYLEAARRVSEFLILKPDGIVFAPHPVVAETDRDKYCVQRIIDFYQRQATDYAEYLFAAWRYEHRARLAMPEATLDEVAKHAQISPKYLETVWALLAKTEEKTGPIAALQVLWRALPEPGIESDDSVWEHCARVRDLIVQLRAALVPEVENLQAPRVHSGSQPLVLWKDRQFAANRMRYAGGVLDFHWSIEAVGESGSVIDSIDAADRPEHEAGLRQLSRGNDAEGARLNVRPGKGKPLSSRLPTAQKKDKGLLRVGTKSIPAGVGEALAIPDDESERKRYEAGFGRFCAVFPDAFYVSERARVYLDPEKEKALGGRLLSAGFHSMTGYFRDDEPLCQLMLDDAQKRELDRLWDEFHFISSVPMRMHTSFIWFERSDSRFMMSPEFHFARSEDKDSTSEAKIHQLATVYLAKVRENGASEIAVSAIEEHFQNVNTNVRRVEGERLAAEPIQLNALLAFAERAYRRPLNGAERVSILEFYQSLRRESELDHESAMRDTIVSILMSPHFCYRIDLFGLNGGGSRDAVARVDRVGSSDNLNRGSGLVRLVNAGTEGEAGGGGGLIQPANVRVESLSDYALASRLSYFLWSSMPDAALIESAADGALHRPDVLMAQANRMLRDPRVRGLATEFGGNWLDFRRFEEHNAVDRGRFPSFDNELREAMFEEPVRFFLDLVQSDRSVLEFLYATHTFVNPVLAKHYEIPSTEGSPEVWTRIDDADRFERGGLLPMAVFLTKNAPGLRTSPVKRGYWVVRRLLGERIPPPPPNVPELPNDEAKLGDLTLREALARHRADKACAGCHERFDAMGLVFEGYGPIGERRSLDLGGRPVETRAAFPDDGEGQGLEGLRRYLKERRQKEFVDNLCRKMLAYGLGRNLILSDDLTIAAMHSKLTASGYRFSTLIECIITSPQFLNRRSRPVSTEQ